MNKSGILTVLIASAACLTACGGNNSSGQNPAAAQVPAEVRQAVQAAPAQPAPPSAKTVDTCAMLSKADAESVIGALTADPQVGPARGSLLGQCTYPAGRGDSITISAHPADEFDGTVGYSSKSNSAQPVADLGGKAFQTPYGLMIQPAGKPYFIAVLVMKSLNIDSAAGVAVAKKLKL